MLEEDNDTSNVESEQNLNIQNNSYNCCDPIKSINFFNNFLTYSTSNYFISFANNVMTREKKKQNSNTTRSRNRNYYYNF